jgi:hypothetical protein
VSPPPRPKTGGRPDRRHRLAERARDWLVPERDAAGVVYGTITMGALLAAESPGRESFPDTVAAAVLALALVWAAHAYATVLGYRLGRPDPKPKPPARATTRAAEVAVVGPPGVQATRAGDEAPSPQAVSQAGRLPASSDPTSDLPADAASDLPADAASDLPADAASDLPAGRPRLPAGELGRLLGHELAVLKGGAVPLVALLVSWAAGARLGTAITATLWTCAGTIVVAELVAGLRTSAGPLAIALQVAAGGALGVAVIALKVILH